MTLVVSLRIPDGIVLAADSQSTTMGTFGLAANIKAECPNCHQNIELKDYKMPPLPIPSSVQSYAQKLFPFRDKFGVAFFGAAILNNRTIYYHVKSLEKEKETEDIDGVTAVAKLFGEYFHGELKKQIADLDNAPDNFCPFGFQVVGYDGQEGKTVEVLIGKVPKINQITGIGCTVSGDNRVVRMLWDLPKTDPRAQILYDNFSLQDAVDYANFLIDTTAKYQRFANFIPSVGGEIDIALVTPFTDFVWIKRKQLMKTLESS